MRIVTLDCEIKETLGKGDSRWNAPEKLSLSVLGIQHDTDGFSADFWYSPDTLPLNRADAVPSKNVAQQLIDEADLVISFNGETFDFVVLEGAGFDMTHARKVHYDLLVEFALASSHPEDPPRFGYNSDMVRYLLMNANHRISLDGMCQALGVPQKTGTGSLAPQLWESADQLAGQKMNPASQASAAFLYNAVIDYCLNDAAITRKCFEHLRVNGGAITYFNYQFQADRTIRLWMPEIEKPKKGKLPYDPTIEVPF